MMAWQWNNRHSLIWIHRFEPNTLNMSILWQSVLLLAVMISIEMMTVAVWAISGHLTTIGSLM